MAETADVERKLAAMANWRTGLEPGYLLRLFFRFPPQDFMAWPQEIPPAGTSGRPSGAGFAAAAKKSAPESAAKPELAFSYARQIGAGNNAAVIRLPAGAKNLIQTAAAHNPAAAAVAGAEGSALPDQKAAAAKAGPAAARAAGIGGTVIRPAETAENASRAAGAEVAAAETAPPDINSAAHNAEAAEIGNAAAKIAAPAAAIEAAANAEHPAPSPAETVAPPPAAVPLFACRFNLLTVLEPEWLKKLKKLPFYRSFSRMLSFKTLFAGATVSEFLPLPLPLPAASAAAAAGVLRAEGGDWPFVIAKDLPQGENALVSADIAAAAAAFDAALAARGFISVEGQALAYVPVDFADLNAYLARFSKARRKNFRRKLRAREELSIDILTKGAAEFYDEAALALYYRLYEQVYAQSETHFDYLSRDFFRALLQEADDSLRFIRYHDKAGRLIGYNICFIVGDRLVDKYIGLDYPAATDYSIYFVSWFYNLEYAREQGLRYYVAGWTDPQVKACLGAKFVMTRHRVFIRNPLLRAALRRMQFLFEGDAAAAAGRGHNAVVKAGTE